MVFYNSSYGPKIYKILLISLFKIFPENEKFYTLEDDVTRSKFGLSTSNSNVCSTVSYYLFQYSFVFSQTVIIVGVDAHYQDIYGEVEC